MLQKIEVPLVVSGGIDTKTDRKLVPDQKMIKTENVDFSKLGTLKKSKGTTQLTASTDTSDDIDDISSSIFSHNNEIVVLGKQGSSDIYSYSDSSTEWKTKANFDGQYSSVPCEIEVKQGEADYLNCTSSSLWEFPLAGFKIVASVVYKSDGSAPLRVSKIDYSTGNEEVFEPDTSNASIYETRVLGVDDATDPVIWVVVSYIGIGGSSQTDQVTAFTFDKDISQIGSAATLSQDNTATPVYPIFDAVIVDGVLFYAACTNKTVLNIGYVGTNGSISQSDNYSVSNNICVNDNGTWTDTYNHPNISCCLNGNRVYVAFFEYNLVAGDRDVFLVGFNKASLATVDKTESKVVDKTSYPSIWYRVDIFQQPIQSATDALILTISGYNTTSLSGKNNIYTETNIFDVNWTSSLTATIINSSGPITNSLICSKGFSFIYTISPNVFYYIMSSSSYRSEVSTFNLVKFYFDTSWKRVIIGKFFNNNAVDEYTREYDDYFGGRIRYNYMGVLNPLVLSEDDKYYFPCIVKADLVSESSISINSLPFYTVKTSIVSINIDGDSDIYSPARLSQSTHLSGSVVREYDGTSLRYGGFQKVPYVTYTLSASNPITDGTYQYKLIYVYYDNNGEVHYSGESEVDTVTTSSQSVVITRSPVASNDLNLEKDAVAEIAIYRTTDGTGGPFYFVGRMESDETTFNDIYEDSTIEANETIYTNGGVLFNSIIPPMSHIASGINRIFGVSLEDKNKIYYSQKRIVENSIEWNEALYFRVDGHGKNAGEALGVANLDDKMIILKDDSLLYVSGDGPLPTGSQNTFTEPVVVSQEIGCSEVKSIVETPIGVMFKGKKGIYIVDRALAVKYIGAAVEEYNSETINGADVSKIRNEVYFQTSSRLMIYNYLQDKWSTNTYLGGKSICIWKYQLAALKSDGLVYYQDESLYTDNTANISMKVTTPWYKLKGITGYGRLYEIIILGEYKSDHTLNVRVYYDYDETDYGDYTFDVESINIYEFSVKPSKQKCQSFKIEIWDTPTGGSKESLELTGISVRIGAKRGFYKLADSNKG